jgi:L-lactate dehydrogenase complex protein LldG
VRDRQRFLDAVRAAVREGNRAGGAPPLPQRGNVGHQGAAADPVAKLGAELAAAGGFLHRVADADAAITAVVRLITERSASRVLLAGGPFIDSLSLDRALKAVGVEVVPPGAGREAFFAADVGVTGVEAVIAETGTLVLATRPDQPRAASLLPPVHVAVAHRGQIVADLFDLFGSAEVPACLSLITGPSKTGDIELQLVTGVHGPGEVHLVLVDSA